MFVFPAVAPPMVTVTHSPDTVYTDEDFNLTCTIKLIEQVDTDVTVDVSLTGPGVPDSDPTMVSAGMYESTVTLNLDTAGSRLYVCTAVVSPDGTPFVTGTSRVDTETITIGEYMLQYTQSLIR